MRQFCIIDTDSEPILSLNTCIELNLIHKIDNINMNSNEILEVLKEKQQFIDKNSHIFHGLGNIPFKYKIRLKEDAVPVVKSPRRVPDVIKPRLKKKLNQMENLGIISKVTKQTIVIKCNMK